MATAFRNTESAKEEIAQLHIEIGRLENRVDTLRESLRKTFAELFGTGPPCIPRASGSRLGFTGRGSRVLQAVVDSETRCRSSQGIR